MKRSARRPARLARLGFTLAVAVLALTACELGNPATGTSPYPASDGTDGTITDPAGGTNISLQNFLLVSEGRGQPGNLVGAIANDGRASVTVSLTLYKDDSAATASQSDGESSVEVPAGGLVTLGQPAAVATGAAAPSLVLGSTPQPPGALLTLRAQTAAGGSVQFTIPVMAPVGPYSSLKPTAAPTPSSSATPTPSASS